MSLGLSHRTVGIRRFPRVSGDEPTDRFARYLIVEFSPRERG